MLRDRRGTILDERLFHARGCSEKIRRPSPFPICWPDDAAFLFLLSLPPLLQTDFFAFSIRPPSSMGRYFYDVRIFLGGEGAPKGIKVA